MVIVLGALGAPSTFMGVLVAADEWREILRESIDNSSQPIIGTHFRALIGAAASKRGLQFPPVAEPGLRFIELLERYPDVVSVLRRPGQDFLVVPAGRSDLLARGIQGQLYGIRPDLFQAFTSLSSNRPYYDRERDQVVWRKLGDGQAMPESWVPIEPSTEAGEFKLRRDFAETFATQSSTHSRLLEALENPHPLQAFSRVVKEARLQREWHSFRTEHLVEKIQSWAKASDIGWKDAWLTKGPTDETWKDRPAVLAEAPAKALSDPLRVLISGLDPADIQRINIPLDLVLKVITASKKP